MHHSEADDSDSNNLNKELCRANKTWKALIKYWAYSKCSEHTSFYFTFLKINKQKGINFSCVWWKHSMVKSEKQLCWLVLSQLDTSEGRFGRENLHWENAPTRLVCGQFCGVLSWLVCAEFVSWWAVPSFGQWYWILWEAVYISQEEQARKQHSCMASLSVSVSGFMDCLSSCFSFSQWWSVTWQCKLK